MKTGLVIFILIMAYWATGAVVFRLAIRFPQHQTKLLNFYRRMGDADCLWQYLLAAALVLSFF